MIENKQELSLKTKITFEESYIYYTPLELKDGSILLFSINKILIFHKNSKSNILLNIKEGKNFDKNSYITNMKQFKNGEVYCCCGDLYVFTIKSKIIDTKIIKRPNNEKIFDIIELKNGKIYAISNTSIYSIDNIEKEPKILEIYKILEDWKNKQAKKKQGFLHSFEQYINIFDIPNNRLLIHFSSIESINSFYDNSVILDNKVICINLDSKDFYKFEDLYLSEEIKIVILKNYICITNGNTFQYINIYNINNCQLIKKCPVYYRYIIKFTDDIILGMRGDENENEILIFNLSKINNIRYKKLKADFIFKYSYVEYEKRNYQKKSLYKLKNGDIVMIMFGRMYFIKIPKLLKIQYLNFDDKIKYI